MKRNYQRIAIRLNKSNFITFILIVFFGGATKLLLAQTNSECYPCQLPRHPESRVLPEDQTLTITFKNEVPPLYGLTSLKRETISMYGRLIQGIRVYRFIDKICVDTVIKLDDVNEIRSSGIGTGGQTLILPVLPAREFYQDEDISKIKTKSLELSFSTNFLGSDNSTDKIGFSSPIPQLSILANPFGSLLNNKFKILLSCGLLVEDGRVRFPLGSQLRWTIFGDEYEEEFYDYYPSECKFGIMGEVPIAPEDEELIEVPSLLKQDSTVYFTRQTRVIRDEYRPFLLAELGSLLNGNFTGSGSSPSINPEEYGQYYYKVGLGLPLFEIVNFSLSYKYQIFNLRTPCLACSEKYIVNTIKAEGLELALALYFNY